MQQQALIELSPTNVTLDVNFAPTGGIGGAGWFKVHDLYSWLICAAWTGVPEGNFYLEGTPNTPDPTGAVAVPANRIFTIAGTVVAAGSAPGQNAWERLTQSGFPYVRLNYAFIANSGTLSYVSQTGVALRDT